MSLGLRVQGQTQPDSVAESWWKMSLPMHFPAGLGVEASVGVERRVLSSGGCFILLFLFLFLKNLNCRLHFDLE